MLATPSWPGLFGPSVAARACGDGPDKPGHDAEATSSPISTPMVFNSFHRRLNTSIAVLPRIFCAFSTLVASDTARMALRE